MEFAILTGPILVLTFMIVQASLVWYAHSVALGAATQGANSARLYGSSPAVGNAEANRFLDQIGPALTDVNVTTRIAGNRVEVVVTGRAQSVLPWLTFRVRQTASGPVERWIP
ncbi:MAG: pilus assembly protein [Hamadaea sp.]|uniref:TadE family protein n=1 Tax=Hamadaea sp. TaxID=2024425 RepID=UPI0017C9B7D1|nr:TadE family protein [Hamadaea sp.]NUR72215.1 pilus assembly protein [Hamadaea sp.]NUT22108.1 pilus assembly protein [Hamadaea sp.]